MEKQRKQGIHPLHLGFFLDRLVFPPSQFALAWIGVEHPKKLKASLDAVVQDLFAERLDPEEAPQLYQWMKMVYDQEHRFLSLEDLRQQLKVHYGTAKMIDRKALKPVNKQGHQATVSSKHTVSVVIESRRKGQKQRAYPLTFRHPFLLPDDPLSVYLLTVEGGSLHEQKNIAKSSHWGEQEHYEKGFVSFLANEGKEAGLLSEDVYRDYRESVVLFGYTRAAGLLGLAKLLKEKPHAVKGLSEKLEVLVPFSFEKTPQYAFEIFTRVYYQQQNSEEHFFAHDRFFLGKKGFLSSHFQRLHQQGLVTKQVLPYQRSFSQYAWAMLQAMETYQIKRRRRFQGYNLVFQGTPWETVSIVFQNPQEHFSVHLLYGEAFPLPYLLYVDFAPEFTMKGIHSLGKRSIYQMINLAKDIHHKRYPLKRWLGEDYRTGKKALFSLYEPNENIRFMAAERSQVLGKGISANQWRTKYIEQYFALQKQS